MKKALICAILISISFMASSCNIKNSSLPEVPSTDIVQDSSTGEAYENMPSVESYNPLEQLEIPEDQAFNILDKIGNTYIGLNEMLRSDGIVSTEKLYNSDTNALTTVAYPTNFPRWSVAASSELEMGDRFLYEWRSYTNEFSGSTKHDVKLTKIDIITGEVAVIAEKKLDTPFVWLCKLDDEHFLSYYVTKADSDKTEYATLTVAEVFDTHGNSKEIIRERYENAYGWENSEGTLLDRMATDNGKIFAIGRKNINTKCHFFLYEYDLDGKLISTQELKGFEEIIGDESPNHFDIVGDYFIVRTYQTSTSYICKQTADRVELISEGLDGSISYGISDKMIYFVKSNVNQDTDIAQNKECPLYALNTDTGIIKIINWEVPLKNPYFTNFKALSNGDLMIAYCEKEYDPVNRQFFIVSKDTIDSFIS